MKSKLTKWMKALAACGAALTLMGSVAVADTVTLVEPNAWGTGSAGGPFEVDATSLSFTPRHLGVHGVAANSWLTFCVERNEYLSKGGVYDVVVNTAAVGGGLAGGNPDPIDARTAFLYTHFLAGDLNTLLVNRFGGSAINFDYQNTNGGTDEAGAAIQNAIWKLEQEITTSYGNATLAGQLLTLANEAVSTNAWSGIGNVRVLNMTSNNGATQNQDVLVMVPAPASAVGGAVLLAGLAATGLKRKLKTRVC